MSRASVTVIIPFYNNTGCIAPLLAELSQASGIDRFLFVDDASTDGTVAEILDNVGAFGNRVEVYQMPNNVGSHVAVRAMLARCTTRFALVMAGDGQDDPAHFEAIIQRLNAGHHLVFTVGPAGHGWFEMGFHGVLSMLYNHDEKAGKQARPWYMIGLNVDQIVQAEAESTEHLYHQLLSKSASSNFIEVTRRARTHGQSQWTTTKKMTFAFGWIWAAIRRSAHSHRWVADPARVYPLLHPHR